jgi:outer membrane protein assembly factor BamB
MLLGLVIVAAGAAAAMADSASTTYQIDPAHDGVVTFSKPFAPPLKTHWVAHLGAFVSYPVVSGGLVIVQANGPRTLSLVAYDIGSGQRAWIRSVPGGYFPGSFLASDGGSVFVATAFKPIQAFEAATGKALWVSKVLGSDGEIVPVALDGRVYGGASEDGTVLFSLSEKTGAVEWTVLEDGGGVGATVGGGKLYFPASCDAPAYVPLSGKPVWDYNLECDGGGGAVAAFYKGRLYAPQLFDDAGVIIDTATGAPVTGLAGPSLPAFTVDNAVSISGGAIVASDIASGNLRWYFAPKDGFTIPPIVINGNVYALSDGGVLYVNAGATGKLLQSIKVCSGAAAFDTLAGYRGLGAGQDTLFVPCGSTLIAIGP